MSCHHEFATLFSHRRVRWRRWNEMLRELLPILVWAVCDVLGSLWRAQGLPFVPRVFIISDTYRNMGLGVEKVLEVKIIFWEGTSSACVWEKHKQSSNSTGVFLWYPNEYLLEAFEEKCCSQEQQPLDLRTWGCLELWGFSFFLAALCLLKNLLIFVSRVSLGLHATEQLHPFGGKGNWLHQFWSIYHLAHNVAALCYSVWFEHAVKTTATLQLPVP